MLPTLISRGGVVSGGAIPAPGAGAGVREVGAAAAVRGHRVLQRGGGHGDGPLVSESEARVARSHTSQQTRLAQLTGDQVTRSGQSNSVIASNCCCFSRAVLE